MSTTLYSQRPPPPPPPAGMAEGGMGHPAPLTRENITLLQALTQPSRLRRRVAPNFEVVSYDDPDGMEYSLSRFRPADSQDAAPASERTVAAGEATGRPRHGGAGGGRGDRYSGQDGDERPSQRSHPARPPPPLPAGRERAAPDSQGQGRSSNNNNNNDNGYPSGTAGGDDGGRRAPAQGGRLNMQALEDQFGRGQDDSRGLRGARREDLSQRPIYASRDSDDDSYRKRPMSHNLPASQWDEVRGGAAAAPGQNRGNDYNVDSSRPARFQEHLQASGDDDGYGRGRRGQHHSSRRETEEAKGAVNYDDEEEEEEREDTDVSNTSGHHRHPRRPLRDAWQADHSDQGSNDDVDGGSRDGYGGRQQRHPDHRNGGVGGGDDDDEYPEEEEEADLEALSGDVLSCDEYDRQVAAAAKDRVPRQPPQQQRQPPPPPPKAPVRGQAYPRGAPLHNTRENVTEPQATGNNRKKDKGSKSKKPANARHNPKAFQNKTTYSWISTNTTTTVILPAATVQLMPVHGFAPVVEEVLEHDGTRWALPPAHSSSFPPAGQHHHHHHHQQQQQQQQYMLNAPQSAGYPHRPSQMTVLDDSDEVTGRVGSSLPQLGRRGYDSGSYARDSMSEL